MSTLRSASVGLARRIALAQVAAGLGVALVASFVASVGHALAATMGALAILLATLLMARFALGGGIQSSETVMFRWVAGMLSKWIVIAATLWLAIGPLGLPPLAVLAGVVAALIASAIAALSKS